MQQRKQIDAFRAAWKEAGHEREPRVSVSRSIFAIVDDRDRAYFGRSKDRDQIGYLDENTRAVFGRSYAEEPEALAELLKEDTAIEAADTLLLTVPNQLGVEYNAHVLNRMTTSPASAGASHGARNVSPPRSLVSPEFAGTEAMPDTEIREPEDVVRAQRAVQARSPRPTGGTKSPRRPPCRRARANIPRRRFPSSTRASPASEAELDPPPMYDAPFYKGSGKLDGQGRADHRRRFRHRPGGGGAVRPRRRRRRDRLSRRARGRRGDQGARSRPRAGAAS